MREEMATIIARYQTRHAGLDAVGRALRVTRECKAGLERLREDGVRLTMPGHELEALLGNDI